MSFQEIPTLVIGEERTVFSIVVNLLEAQHPVTLCTSNEREAILRLNDHLSDLMGEATDIRDRADFEICSTLNGPQDFRLAIVLTPEDIQLKHTAVRQLENVLSPGSLIAVNTESIPLSEIHTTAVAPERIFGANWTEPAHTTFFLEIIVNDKNCRDLLNSFVSTACTRWQKDPYVLYNDCGIRSRMLSAMVREAFFLLENDYVSVEDVDRACRNDPGYYLPFAGHCRYMDLMGAYVYGTVMKDLNPELSKDTRVAPFFTRIVEAGGEGISTENGFYRYETGEAERRTKEFRKFSFEIRDIIARYPFGELEEKVMGKKNAISNI